MLLAQAATHAPSPPSPRASLYEALERESERITRCRTVADTVEQLIKCDCETWKRLEPLHRSRPELTLSFEREGGKNGALIDTKLPNVLAALTRVLSHSCRLNVFPVLKMAFWEELLKAKLLPRHGSFDEPYNWLWMTQHESFPIFRIGMNSKGETAVDHTDALFTFFMTPAPHGDDGPTTHAYPALAQPRTQ